MFLNKQQANNKEWIATSVTGASKKTDHLFITPFENLEVQISLCVLMFQNVSMNNIEKSHPLFCQGLLSDP